MNNLIEAAKLGISVDNDFDCCVLWDNFRGKRLSTSLDNENV